MRIISPSNPNWMRIFEDIGSLPALPSANGGYVAVVKDDGTGEFAGMLWDGTMWVQAFGPAIVESVTLNLRQHNFAAIVDPTVDDDETEGYEVGSRWVNLATNTHWVCVDQTDGAAAWLRTDNVGAGGTFLVQKSGIILPAAFSVSGSHQVATVNFSTPFSDANYSVAISAQSVSADGRRYVPVVTSRTASAFTVSLGSARTTDLVAASWVATRVGESS